jgi:hypothetical protein
VGNRRTRRPLCEPAITRPPSSQEIAAYHRGKAPGDQFHVTGGRVLFATGDRPEACRRLGNRPEASGVRQMPSSSRRVASGYLVHLMTILRKTLAEIKLECAPDMPPIHPKTWYGPGPIAKEFLSKMGITANEKKGIAVTTVKTLTLKARRHNRLPRIMLSRAAASN